MCKHKDTDKLINSINYVIGNMPDTEFAFDVNYVKVRLPEVINVVYGAWKNDIENPKSMDIEIPIIVKNGEGVLAVDLIISYDPKVLTLINVAKGADTEPNQPSPVSNLTDLTKARICYYRITPLDEGEKEIIILKGTSTVKNPVITLDKVRINENDLGEPTPIYFKFAD